MITSLLFLVGKMGTIAPRCPLASSHPAKGELVLVSVMPPSSRSLCPARCFQRSEILCSINLTRQGLSERPHQHLVDTRLV